LLLPSSHRAEHHESTTPLQKLEKIGCSKIVFNNFDRKASSSFEEANEFTRRQGQAWLEALKKLYFE
jgi:hypothetical protein